MRGKGPCRAKAKVSEGEWTANLAVEKTGIKSHTAKAFIKPEYRQQQSLQY